MDSAPEALNALLAARQKADWERAWAGFVEQHSGLILRVARHMGGGHDAVMDRYAFVLEALAKDDSRRLRAYLDDGTGRFETWLVVVVRRLCLDHHRHRYGRRQASSVTSVEREAERRKLVDLLGDELAMNGLAAGASDDPDLRLREMETRNALDAALDALPVSDRLVLRLRFEEGLSVPQIARVTSAGSPFRLYRHIGTVLDQLRSALRRAGVDEAAP